MSVLSVTRETVTVRVKCRTCRTRFDVERRSAKYCSSACWQKAYRKRCRRSVHFKSDKHDWETPQPLFDEYNAKFGFTLDVCATAENAKCERFFSPEDDGLSQPWGDNICWMNPPYGAAIVRWMEKEFLEPQRLATVVCLVPSRTDTRWWHDFATKGEIRHLQGRLKFGGGSSSAPFASAVIVMKPPLSLQDN